jgi:hypothetical protein
MSSAAQLAIVAHDAGGAEILSSHVRRQGSAYRSQCVFVLAGPARRIFERKLGDVITVPLEEALAQVASILCGTGWQSDWEVDAVIAARRQAKKSIAFLDHWINYRERFVRRGALHLPDEIWVGDPIALDLVHKALPEVPARLVDNPYFLDVQSEFSRHGQRKSEPGGGLSVLYICEPVREHALKQHGNERHWGYTEEDALQYFLDHLPAFGKPITRIVVRPHPSEAPKKYDGFARQNDAPLQFSDGRDLLAEIAASDCVVGCNSMAMVIALLAGKQVVCCIPPGGRPCLLPQPGIVHLQALIAAASGST